MEYLKIVESNYSGKQKNTGFKLFQDHLPLASTFLGC